MYRFLLYIYIYFCLIKKAKSSAFATDLILYENIYKLCTLLVILSVRLKQYRHFVLFYCFFFVGLIVNANSRFVSSLITEVNAC